MTDVGDQSRNDDYRSTERGEHPGDGEAEGGRGGGDGSPARTATAGPTRRAVLRAGAVAGGLATLGGLGAAGGLAPDAVGQDAVDYFPEGPTVGLDAVASGPLRQPVALATADEDADRSFVADQNGQVFVIGPDGVREEPFLDLGDRLVDLQRDDERGLLGLAFHPGFATNRRFFVRYSAPLPGADATLAGPLRESVPQSFDHVEVLAEFRATDDGEAADPDFERRLLEVPVPQAVHNAGDLAFGPDGRLYFGLGDSGPGDTGLGHVEDWYGANAGGNGQDVTRNLLGSVLRIDVDSRDEPRPYGIPDDNPLVGTDGLSEQFAWGFRNPWKLSFDSGTLLVADVGQGLREEVNLVERGGNYGWNVKEGTLCFSTDDRFVPRGDCPDAAPDAAPYDGQPLRDPVVEYPHAAGGATVGGAVVGGHVYRGGAVPDLRGRYVFGDWGREGAPRGRLLVASPTNGVDGGIDPVAATGATLQDGQWPVQELVVAGRENGDLGRYVLGFGRDPAGELLVLTSDGAGPGGNGAVHRIVPAEGGG